MQDLRCRPSKRVGPPDPRVVAQISERYPLDPDYLACMQTCHGCTPGIKTIQIGAHWCDVAMFLTLVDEKSTLPGRFRPHFEDEQVDERVVNSVTYLMWGEHSTSRALFTGLVPFAAVQANMCLDRAYVDLFCFDYRETGKRPTVVLWVSHDALGASMEWEHLRGEASEAWTPPWERFLVPIAESFSAFTDLLRRPPPSKKADGDDSGKKAGGDDSGPLWPPQR